MVKNKMWDTFKKTFSNYSTKTAHYYKILVLKGDIFMTKRKKGKYFKQLGRALYEGLLQQRGIETILENVQPVLTKIDELDSEVKKYADEISSISKNENISTEEVQQIEDYFNQVKLRDDEEEDEE